ncbi:hypothetical protein L5F68_05595 [Aliarcobacter butzleri]|uniref:hypothetical protein n=1 Tax=Aliarcobacter butzleri TaxID=28197 RepID=UPI001EE10EA2|nr:hypothetical protein [Aliarcobacter butzleri]MCG3703805.1 hypothetical protein [Aliarcobacter butzleri]
MIIKKIAFGNSDEAFIESRLTNNLNVLYSDDNNRGKTLVMQGLMYSLGYESIFPSTFNYKNYYFYSNIEFNKEEFEFLRKGNSIVVKTSNSLQLFNSIGEFRYFFNDYIHELPRIEKDGKVKIVDLTLFYELFFIGQDARKPSDLISRGQFNKADFKNMIYSLAGLSKNSNDEINIQDIKEKLENTKTSLKETRKKISLIKGNPKIAEVFSKTFDSECIQKKMKSIHELNTMLSELRKTRQREINRKIKLETLVSELNSLNRNLREGNVKCWECGSDKIIYTNQEISFDISNNDVKNEILKSIRRNIDQKNEIIFDYTNEINEVQNLLSREMKDSPPSFQELVIYQDQIVSDIDYDDEAFSLVQKIEFLQSKLDMAKEISETITGNKKEFDNKVLETMESLYHLIDPNGNLKFSDIFTTKNSTFSGSEEQEFYFSKVVALSNVLKHNFPIIIDSFRDGEISSLKEDRMLEVYANLKKQVILTSTLKDEEYKANKYSSNPKINAIDYSTHNDCKILSKEYKNNFLTLLENFQGIII